MTAQGLTETVALDAHAAYIAALAELERAVADLRIDVICAGLTPEVSTAGVWRLWERVLLAERTWQEAVAGQCAVYPKVDA